MYSTRASIRLIASLSGSNTRTIVCYPTSTRANNYSTNAISTGYSTTASAGATEEEIEGARKYCTDLLRKYDSPSHTLLAFIPQSSRIAYLAIRAFNIEIARIAETASNPTVGAMRLQFWRDTVNRTFSGSPPKQPVALLLAHAIDKLAIRTNSESRMNKSFFLRLISAREAYQDDKPFQSLANLERYAENTYSSLLYLTLSSLPSNSLHLDHLASHIGKAAGIIAVLRGVPLLAFPPAPNHHTNTAGLGGTLASTRNNQTGHVTLPLDILAETSVSQESILRQGAKAPNLPDAIFTIATRASDHLITARSMSKNLREGKAVDHDYEHEHDNDHKYPSSNLKHIGPGPNSTEAKAQYNNKSSSPSSSSTQSEHQSKDPTNDTNKELDRAWGVFMPAIATQLWLERLQKVDFDIFDESLRAREWKLPWKAYFAFRGKTI